MHDPMERCPDVTPWHSALGPWVNHNFCEVHTVGKLIGSFHGDEQMHTKEYIKKEPSHKNQTLYLD